MKGLFVTDLHIKIPTFDQLDGLTNYLKEWFKKNSVSFIVIGGDTLDSHERICLHALKKACEFTSFLMGYGHVYILVGNHDYINNSQFLSKNHWLNCLEFWPGVTVVDEPMYIDHLNITCVPYTFPGRFNEALFKCEKWQESKVIFAHQEFKGCKMGSITSLHGDEWNSHIPIISGHIHEKQELENNIYYPGSSLSHSFTHKCFGPCVVDLEKVTISHIGYNYSKKQIHVNPEAVENVSLPKDTRLLLTGPMAQVLTIYKNPMYKDLLKKSKKKYTDIISFNDWENYLETNIKTRTMKDDVCYIQGRYITK